MRQRRFAKRTRRRSPSASFGTSASQYLIGAGASVGHSMSRCTGAAGTISYRSVESILDTKLDAVPLESSAITTRLPATHAHVRGAAYYDPATDTSPLTLLLTDAVC